MMKILHVLLTRLSVPPSKYGGTERVLWALYKGQIELGHEVKFLIKSKSNHSDAIMYDPSISIEKQVEGWADIIHFHFLFRGKLNTPFVCTTHNQQKVPTTFPKNTIFLGKAHAKRSGGEAYVYNGLFWDDYGSPNFKKTGDYVHFLANGKYRDKNLKESIEITRAANSKLEIIGSKRCSLKYRLNGECLPYLYLGRDLSFHGMLGGEKKNRVIRNSKALLFPVLNYEAFGLSMIESLFLGCPVIGSNYGSIPEIVIPEVGISTNSKTDMINAIKSVDYFSRMRCHEYARDTFNHLTMSKKYIQYYEKVLNNNSLHQGDISFTKTLKLDLKLTK